MIMHFTGILREARHQAEELLTAVGRLQDTLDTALAAGRASSAAARVAESRASRGDR